MELLTLEYESSRRSRSVGSSTHKLFQIGSEMKLSVPFGEVKIRIELYSARTFGFDELCFQPIEVDLYKRGLYDNKTYAKQLVFAGATPSDFGLLNCEISMLSGLPVAAGIFGKMALSIQSLKREYQARVEK
jgi:hypothetical protein